ncbi:hypothetical protein Dimus_014119 [Dionaea muscipula]
MGTNISEDLIQGPTGGVERIFVSVRMRPLNEKEMTRNEVVDWECINDNTIVYKNHSAPERSMYPTSYAFDRVFRCNCSTRQVYEEAAKEVALSVVGGINSSVFAYGQTSSGKTYTMTGITEYTMADIFDYIQKHKEREFVLTFSAMEIYNESVRDLLSPDSCHLRLLDDPERGTVVEKLTEETLRDWEHLKELLSICEAQRQIGETCLNEASSRSHQILRLTIESSARENVSKDISSSLAATVNFVDLAGSERASQASTGGSRLKEGCHINRSLLTLGSVIRKLSKGRNGHIPYRDSKLTRILQSSLGGNSRTAIICTMSPARGYVEQSRNTLLFASCAKDVSTNAHVNVQISDKALVKHLQRELTRLESELRSALPSRRADAGALLMEKDLQIEKLECEVRELALQRDLALAQLQDLQQGMTDDKSTLTWGGQDPCYPKLHIRGSWGSLSSGASTLVDYPSIGPDSGRFQTSDSSVGHSESVFDENFLLCDFEEDLLPRSSSQKILTESLSDISSDMLNETPNSLASDSHPVNEVIKEQTAEHFEDFCREVRCIEFEGSTVCDNVNVDSTPLFPEVNEKTLLPLGDENTDSMNQDKGLKSPGQGMETSNHCAAYSPHCKKEQPLALDIDDGLECKNVTPVHSVPLSWPEKSEKDGTELASLYSNDKEFFGKLQDIQRKLYALRSDADSGILSRKSFEISIANIVVDRHQVPDTKSLTDDHEADNNRSITETKELTKVACEKELASAQVEDEHMKENKPIKNVKSGGLDAQDELRVAPWPSDFKKLQREIIDLWHFCNVSLIYRTYFFLVFNDDPADAIYMEVERRRLSFIKDAFSWGHEALLDGHVITPGSSMRAVRQEREMLTKLMKKRLCKQERKSLYTKWGIGLDTKKRSLQLANRLWADKEQMEHITDSAEVVARVTKLHFHQVRKEMFGINLIPRQHRRKLSSWKLSTRLLL